MVIIFLHIFNSYVFCKFTFALVAFEPVCCMDGNAQVYFIDS